MSKAPTLAWTRGLSKEDVEILEQQIVDAAPVLTRLTLLLDELETQTREKMRKRDKFDREAWAYQVADDLAYERCLHDIKQLIKVK